MAKSLSSGNYFSGIIKNNRTILSKAITLTESNKPEHKKLACEIVEKCYPHSGNSIRIGITGAPGVGKSTFIEALGNYLLEASPPIPHSTWRGGKKPRGVRGKAKIAILAIDPSSKKSGGSILGDKTRMEKLSSSENAFVRPSPSSGELGGTGIATREAIILCEAAGYEIIFVETVGVGQSEVDVSSMVDFFLLLTIAGAGDELQGIKRGIMEMADIVVINKEDHAELRQQISNLKAQISGALHLLPASESGWVPNVLSCSSLEGKGIDAVWQNISEYFSLVKKNRFFLSKRKEQLTFWFRESIERELKNNFYLNKNVQDLLKKSESEILKGKINPTNAAREIFNKVPFKK